MKNQSELFFLCFLLMIMLNSCSPSVTSNITTGEDLSNYKCILWPSEIKGDRDLDYVMFEVYSTLKATKLEVISDNQLNDYPLNETLIAHCRVSQSSSESAVTVDFKNGTTDLPVLYVKGSFGWGWGINADMRGAIKSVKKKLLKLFPHN